MGGAFIGLADDWSAIYFNPAGLAQLEGREVVLRFMQANPAISESHSVANQSPGGIFPNVYKTMFGTPEITQFKETDAESAHYYYPGIAGYQKLGEWTLGWGPYVVQADYIDWEDHIEDVNHPPNDIDASFERKMFLLVTNFSLAREVRSNFMVGAGLNVLYLRLKNHIRKAYTNYNPTPSLVSYTFHYDMNTSGVGLEGLFGLLYKPTDRFSIGCVYRTGDTLHLDGRAHYSLIPYWPAESSDVDQHFHHPPTYGVGIAYRPIERLVLTADWTRTDWTDWGNYIRYETEGIGLKSPPWHSLDWDRSDKARLGAEYTLRSGVKLRAGVYYDPPAAPSEQVGLDGIVDTYRRTYSLGVGWKAGLWKIDAGYLYAWGRRYGPGESRNTVEAHSLIFSFCRSFL
jgi:long-chain fatty acid transport protein